MKTINFELNGRENVDKTRTIFLRITENRKHLKIKTGIKVFKTDFNKKAKFGKWIRESNQEHAKLNETLRKLYNGADDSKQGTSESIINKISGNDTDSFFKYTDFLINRFEGKEKIRSAMRYNSVKNKLVKFIADKHKGKKDLLLSDITVTFLKDYEVYMKSKFTNCENTIHANFRVIRSILYEAIQEDKLPQEKNPFFK